MAPAAGLNDWGADVISGGPWTFVAGTTEPISGKQLMFVSRYDSFSGALLETEYFPIYSSRTTLCDVKKMAYHYGGGTEDPSYLAITGQISGLDGSVDIVTVVYNTPESDLTQRWYRIYSNGPCDESEVIPLDDIPVDVRFNRTATTVAVAGISASCNTGTDFITLAYQVSDGTPILQQRYTGTTGDAADWPVGVRFTLDGRIITAGTVTLPAGRAVAAVEYDPNVNPPLVWSMNYPIAGRHVDAKAMEMANDGLGFYLTATTTPLVPGGTNKDVALFKFNNSNGAPTWTPTPYIQYNNSLVNGDDEPAALDTYFDPVE